MSGEVEREVRRHVMGTWSDRTYSCQSCSLRREAELDADDSVPMSEKRSEYIRVSHPGWTLDDWHAHVAAALAPVIDAEVERWVGVALEGAAVAIEEVCPHATAWAHGVCDDCQASARIVREAAVIAHQGHSSGTVALGDDEDAVGAQIEETRGDA